MPRSVARWLTHRAHRLPADRYDQVRVRGIRLHDPGRSTLRRGGELFQIGRVGNDHHDVRGHLHAGVCRHAMQHVGEANALDLWCFTLEAGFEIGTGLRIQTGWCVTGQACEAAHPLAAALL